MKGIDMQVMNMKSFQPLWSVKEVAVYLGVSRSWVYYQAEAGHLPIIRIGGLLRFDPEAIQFYARQRCSG